MATWWKWPVLVLALFLAPIRALEVVEESEEPTEYEHINSIPYELVKKAPTERGKYSKSVLAEGYPFAEISGLDFSDSKDIAAAVKNLRQDIVRHGLLVFRSSRPQKSIYLQSFLQDTFLSKGSRLISKIRDHNDFPQFGSFWHNDFVHLSDLQSNLPLTTWYAEKLPEFDRHAADIKFTHAPELLRNLRTKNKAFYDKLKQCKIVRTYSVTEEETIVMHRSNNMELSWPKNELEVILFRYAYIHKWQPFDFVVADNNQLLHFLPVLNPARDGRISVKQFYLRDWIPEIPDEWVSPLFREEEKADEKVEIVQQAEGLNLCTDESFKYSYTKKELHPDFPFVELIGIDATMDSGALAPLAEQLRKDIVQHGLVLVHNSRKLTREELKGFFDLALLPDTKPTYLEVVPPAFGAVSVGSYWHNDFNGFLPSLDGYLLPLSLWYMELVPERDPRAGDTRFAYIPDILNLMKSADPQLYDKVRSCKIYAMNPLTKNETVFIHRDTNPNNSWPTQCPCCSEFENFVWRKFYALPWQNFDIVIGDNNQILHHAPQVIRARDGERMLRRLKSSDWWPGIKTEIETKKLDPDMQLGHL